MSTSASPPPELFGSRVHPTGPLANPGSEFPTDGKHHSTMDDVRNALWALADTVVRYEHGHAEKVEIEIDFMHALRCASSAGVLNRNLECAVIPP